MAQSYWLDEATQIAMARIAQNKLVMKAAIGRPVQRRPDTATLLAQALVQPASNPPAAMEQLGKFVQQRYGEGAQHIFPFLGLGPDGKEQVNGSNSGTNPPAFPSPPG